MAVATRALPAADDAAGAPNGGVLVNDPGAREGYTPIFPIRPTRTDLNDMQGRVAGMWRSRYGPGREAYLLEDGHLLRPARMADSSEAVFADELAGQAAGKSR